MPFRVHPVFDHSLGTWISERDILGQTAEWIPDVACAIGERWETGFGEYVRHFLEARHVFRLDLRHPIELLIVD